MRQILPPQPVYQRVLASQYARFGLGSSDFGLYGCLLILYHLVDIESEGFLTEIDADRLARLLHAYRGIVWHVEFQVSKGRP